MDETIKLRPASLELGDLDPGRTFEIRVTARGLQVGSWVNTAEVTTDTPQPNTQDPDTDEATVEVLPVTDLAIVKDGPATVDAGGQVTWDLTVTNEGPDDATGVTVTDALPAGTTFVSASDGCAEATGTVTCAIGDLAAGARATVQIIATAPIALADQTLVNTATAADFVTSVGTPRATSSPSSAARSRTPSASIPARTTRAPSSTKARAVANPMLPSPPVMRATLFSRRLIRQTLTA